MVFRKMRQRVPEFRKYVNDAGTKWMSEEEKDKIRPPLSEAEGSALFGARLFGRWKSVSYVFDGRELNKILILS